MVFLGSKEMTAIKNVIKTLPSTISGNTTHHIEMFDVIWLQ